MFFYTHILTIDLIIYIMKLSQMSIGQVGLVESIKTQQDYKNRLTILGLTKGVKITVIRKAIFNGPIQIKLMDFYLAISKNIADKIIVKI